MATFVQGRRCFTSVREQQQRQQQQPQQRFIVRLSAGEIPAESRERSPWMVEEKRRRLPVVCGGQEVTPPLLS